MLIALFGLLFFALELAVLIEVGSAIGTLTTIFWIVASAVLGVNIMSRKSAQVLRNAQIAAAEGRSPAKDMIEAVLVVFAGILLFIPGFVSDAIGLVLLTPIRSLIAVTAVGSWVARHAPATGSWTQWNNKGATQDAKQSQTIIDAEYTTIDDDK